MVGDKVKKIQPPIRLTSPKPHIQFSKQQVMKIHTILNFYQQTDTLESKIFKIQIVCKIDGNLNSIQKQIDVKQYYKKKKEINVIKILNKPQTELKFRIFVIIKDENVKGENKKQENGAGNKEGILEKSNMKQLNHNSKSVSKNDKSMNKNQRGKQKSLLQNASNQLKKPPPKPVLSTHKSLKVIRFQQNTSSQIENPNIDTDRNYNTNNNDLTAKNNRQSKQFNTVKILPLQQQQNNNNKISSNTNTNTKKNLNQKNIQSIQKQLQTKTKQLTNLNLKYEQIQIKYKQLGNKYQQLNKKYNKLKNMQEAKQLNGVNNVEKGMMRENDEQVKMMKEGYQKLERQYRELKSKQNRDIGLAVEKVDKQSQNRKLNAQIKSLYQQIQKYQTSIKTLKQQNRLFQQLLLQVEEKHKKSGGKSLEQSLNPYKQRIRIMERQMVNLQQQKNYQEKEKRSKISQIDQLKAKIKSINLQNLKSLQIISNKEYQIEKLTKKNKDLQIELKALNKNKKQQDSADEQDQQYHKNSNFKSQRVIGGGQTSLAKLKSQNKELKTKLSIAQKNLQNKQNLLKKFDAFSKQDKKQLQQQVSELKKQNSSLKQKLNSLENNKSSGSGMGSNCLVQLECKMELEKVKKQLQYKTKLQRQLLIQKSQIESRNKTLQEDVVKSKQSIANILNLIHEFGDQGLIEDVNMFLG